MPTKNEVLTKIARLDVRIGKINKQIDLVNKKGSDLLLAANELRKRQQKLQAKFNAPPREDRKLREDVVATVKEVTKRRLTVGPIEGLGAWGRRGFAFKATPRLARLQPGDSITLRFRCLKPVFGNAKGVWQFPTIVWSNVVEHHELHTDNEEYDL